MSAMEIENYPTPIPCDQPSETTNYKVCLVGDSRIGKTRLFNKLMGDTNYREYVPTDGFGVLPWNTPYHTPSGQKIKYTIWDTAGVDRRRGLYDAYYLGSDHVFVMWDGTNKPTKWIEECIERHIPYTLILNTCETLPKIKPF